MGPPPAILDRGPARGDRPAPSSAGPVPATSARSGFNRAGSGDLGRRRSRDRRPARDRRRGRRARAVAGAAPRGRAAGAAVAARGTIAGGVARRVGIGLAALGQGRLPRELDAVLVVDGDHLDEHRVADPADVGHAADVAVGQLADVDQAVLAGQDLDERAEVLDRRDAALRRSCRPGPLRSSPRSCRGPPRPRRRSALERVTVPLSSMSILAPVSSWRRRIVLPPGPMIRPIFSGLIWIWISRGALAEISSRGRLIDRSMARRISRRASRAWSSVSRMISLGDPLDS